MRQRASGFLMTFKKRHEPESHWRTCVYGTEAEMMADRAKLLAEGDYEFYFEVVTVSPELFSVAKGDSP